ncbi:hypothetical protein HDU92_007450 [Lobulomyces angularis]|nr:hypothetical protein HDU92_007450 [Lobulomyces angularis]
MTKVISKATLNDSDAKWIKLKKITWQDPNGKERLWECAERTTRKGDCDAVAIFSVLTKKSDPNYKPETILVTQYRPPVESFCVELPAGLVDEGESCEEAALRELNEETGYIGKVIKSSKIMVNDPGMTNANMRNVTVEVDLDNANNKKVEPNLQEGEFIELHLVEIDTLLSTLNEFSEKGISVDSRLYNLAEGINYARNF